MRSWFDWLLLLAIGCSVSMMLWIMVAQVVYTGGAPLAMLAEGDVRYAVFLSFYTSILAGVLALLLAVPTGFALARWHFPGDWLVEALLIIPVVMSPMALGVALLLVFKVEPGLWIRRHFVFEIPGIVVAQFLVAYSFAVLVMRTTFSGIDVRLEQVARFLGCTRWQAFWRVTLPLSRNGIVAAFVLGWARAIGDFGSTSTLAGAVRGKTEHMPVAIYNALQAMGPERAVGLSIVLTIVTVASLIVVRLLIGGRGT
ncbi:MAG: ABC transporter permease [Candidatus Brocadiia bacterium]